MAAKQPIDVEVQVEDQAKGTSIAELASGLEKAIREEKVRRKKHYAVNHHAQLNEDGTVSVIKRRTISAPITKYSDAPVGAGAKEMARRLKRMQQARPEIAWLDEPQDPPEGIAPEGEGEPESDDDYQANNT